jgi:hypothetical protein
VKPVQTFELACIYCSIALRSAHAPGAAVTPISPRNAVLWFAWHHAVKLLSVATLSLTLRKSGCVPDPSESKY